MRARLEVDSVAVLLSVALAGAPHASTADSPGGLSWEKDFKTAQGRARSLGKPVLVDFWAEWCEWCHKLDATTYRDPTVIELARDFVAAKVNTEGSLADGELAARYGADTLPTIGFVSPAGRLFLRRTSYEGPDVFPATLREARALAGEVQTFEAALDRDAKDLAALAGLGALLADQKLFGEGQDLLRAARKLDAARPAPERKRTRRALAACEKGRGKRGDAVKLLDEALAITPAEPEEDAAALFDLGQIELERGQAEKAREQWRRSIERAPGGPHANRAREALEALPGR